MFTTRVGISGAVTVTIAVPDGPSVRPVRPLGYRCGENAKAGVAIRAGERLPMSAGLTADAAPTG